MWYIWVCVAPASTHCISVWYFIIYHGAPELDTGVQKDAEGSHWALLSHTAFEKLIDLSWFLSL